MDKAPPGKYLFLTAIMIAVSVCKHSQGRYRTIFVHKGHCHLLMASKNKYQMYQWTRPKVTPDFVLDRYTNHRVSPCRTALLIRSDYRWSNLLWATSALLQHLPVDILKGRHPWTSWSARRSLFWTWDRCKWASRRLPQVKYIELHFSRIFEFSQLILVIHKNDANFMFANRYKIELLLRRWRLCVCLIHSLKSSHSTPVQIQTADQGNQFCGNPLYRVSGVKLNQL